MRHGVLETEQERVVVRGTVVIVEVHLIGERVEWDTLRGCGHVGVGLEDGVMGQAARVADGGDELIADVVLGIERVVLAIGRGQVCGIRGETDAARDRQIGAVEGCDGVWIWQESQRASARVGRDGVDDGRIDSWLGCRW